MLKKKNIARIILLAALVLCTISYFEIPVVRSKLGQVFMLFSFGSVESFAGYIRSFGAYAAAVSFLLMVFQSVAAPLPAHLIMFANAAVFGWWRGAVLSWASLMAGAFLCFQIAKITGRDVVVRIMPGFVLDGIDTYFERYGKHTILLCRLIPFISSDFVSYATGFTSMKVVPFLAVTGIGQLPFIVVYSYTGGVLGGTVKTAATVLLIVLTLAVFVSLLKQIYNDRYKKNV